MLTTATSSAAKVERAIGLSEASCREKGNCLEVGDIDGSIGWNWGGKDRCDPTDPKCSINGKLLSNNNEFPVPNTLDLDITSFVDLELRIGKNETGLLRLGLYGNNCPNSVQQFIDFCSVEGLITDSNLLEKEFDYILSSPVSFTNSAGFVNSIYPNEKVDFGILSQTLAYSKKTGYMKRLKKYNFVPQPRPPFTNVQKIRIEESPRYHNTAGLISIPCDGLGYDSILSKDDETFASAFQITTSSSNSLNYMDKEKRKVIGQIVDSDSMRVLARIASLPTQKGLKGILPGQNYGPPLIKVVVERVNNISLKS